MKEFEGSYPNSPLVEVVFEIRFPDEPSVDCKRDVFYEKIRGSFPRVLVPTTKEGGLAALEPYRFESEDKTMTVVTMPKFGMTMEEGAIVRWHRQPGETIQKGEVLLEIESDKAVMEVQSEFTGTVVKYLAPENKLLPCGTPIAEIE